MASVILLVEDSAALTSDDTAIQSQLTGLSHTVTVRDLNDSVATSGFDLLVISRSTGFNTHPDYSGEDIPIFSPSRGSWPMLGWSTDPGNAVGSSVTDLETAGTSHPTHGGFTGTVTILGAASQWRAPNGPPTSLDRRWQVVGSPSNILFTFEPLSSLLSGKSASQRQVGWGFSGSGEIAGLTADGWTVFDAAVDWALGGTTTTQLDVPPDFTFTAASGLRQLDGSWTAVSGADTYDYEVEEDVSGTWTAFASASTASTSFQLTDTDGVDWGTTYRARVRAVPA